MSTMSGIGELALKRSDAEQRLGRSFAALIKVAGTGYFVVGGNIPPTHVSNQNFGCVVIGSSMVEINRGADLIRQVGSKINALFSSEKDFHSTVLMDFLSRYLKANLENMKLPRALAIEFLITDFMDNVIQVHFDGDLEIDSMDNNKDGDSKKIFMIGAYDKDFRGELMTELDGAPKDLDPRAMVEFATKLKSKFNLTQIGFIL